MKIDWMLMVVLAAMIAPMAYVVFDAPVVAKDLREMIPVEHLARGGGWTWYGSHGSFASTTLYALIAWASGEPAQNSVVPFGLFFAWATFLGLWIILYHLYKSGTVATIGLASFALFPAYARWMDMRPSILGLMFVYFIIAAWLTGPRKLTPFLTVILLLWSAVTFVFFKVFVFTLAIAYVFREKIGGETKNVFAAAAVLGYILVIPANYIWPMFDGVLGKYAWTFAKDIGWIYVPMVAPFVVAWLFDQWKSKTDKHVLGVIILVLFCIPFHPWMYMHVAQNGFVLPEEDVVRRHSFPGEPGQSMFSYTTNALYMMTRFDFYTAGKSKIGVQFGDGMPELLAWFREQPVESRYVSLCMYHNNFSITYMDGCHGQDPVTLFEFIPKYSGVLPATEVPLGDIVQMYLSATDRDRLLKQYGVDYLLVTENEEMAYSPSSFCDPVFESGGYKVYGFCGYIEPWAEAEFARAKDIPLRVFMKKANDSVLKAINDGHYCFVEPYGVDCV